MRNFLRITFILSIFALFQNLPFLPVHAQIDHCYGLNADDCQLFLKPPGDSAKLSSFVTDYKIDLKVTGLYNDPTQEVVASGNASFSLDVTKLAAIFSDPLTILNALTVANTTDGATSYGSADPRKSTLEFRIVDGKAYWRGQDLTYQNQWMGLSFASLVKRAMTYPQIATALQLTSNGNPLTQALTDPEFIAALARLPEIAGFIQVERGEDVNIAGQKTSHFITNLNFLALLKSDEFRPIIETIVKTQAKISAIELDDKQINQIIIAGRAFLNDFKFSISRYVGIEDNLSYGFGVDLELKLDKARVNLITNRTDLCL